MSAVHVKKTEPKLQVVYAEVYAPMRPDAHGDFATADDIRIMAWAFLRNLRQRNVDDQHSNELVNSACVVESYIAPENDPVFIAGAWVVGIHIPDPDEWAKVENGTWNGLSMEAYLYRQEVEVEIELPPIIYGTTSEPVYRDGASPVAPDDHVHRIQVAYTDEGVFVGGRTDEVNGHWHSIKNGTITDEAGDHIHRFAHLDDIKISE